MRNNSYRGQVSKILNFDPMSDMVNFEDDQPEMIFGPALNGESPDSDVPPFYISLRLHDFVLHNAMFDSRASHNLMPKAIMHKLGLDITRQYHDLYSFDSSRVRCIGLIKDLVVSLDQLPLKNVLMDVVVAYIPLRFVMLLSKSWVVKLKGTLQLDLSYLKNNVVPKGLIPLEELFDQNYVAHDPTFQPTEKCVEEVNVGTVANPKLVKLSKALPPKIKDKYISLMSSFANVFAWDYSDLKTYDTNIIQHTISIKPNQKPFRQNLRRLNPKLLPSIEKEINRLYKSGIIVPIRFSDWISNLGPVRKKTSEIRLCIDFRNLNKVVLKDNYPLPKMDHILQRVVGASRMSLLDGYSRYNQVSIHENDQDKTMFTTSWGTFHYAKIPFSLNNTGATFQWAMDLAFANEKDVFLVLYLDDLTVFSKSDEEHMYHLKTVFQKCRKYGLSLNPKKSLFAMEEGKLLGHIISKDGIHIDPARVQAI
eukprot:PITA_29302